MIHMIVEMEAMEMDMAHWYISARANELREKRHEFKSLREACITAVIANSTTYLRLQRNAFHILRKLLS